MSEHPPPTAEELAAWLSLAGAAIAQRPAEWHATYTPRQNPEHEARYGGLHGIDHGPPDDLSDCYDLLEDPPKAVVDLFVASRDAVPRLVARVRELEAACRLRNEIAGTTVPPGSTWGDHRAYLESWCCPAWSDCCDTGPDHSIRAAMNRVLELEADRDRLQKEVNDLLYQVYGR
jgi:hypothetical protein